MARIVLPTIIDKSSGPNISADGRSMIGTSGGGYVWPSRFPKSVGKWYFEAKLYNDTAAWAGLVVDGGSTFRGVYTHNTYNVYGYSGGGYAYDATLGIGTVSLGTILGFEVDLNIGHINLVYPTGVASLSMYDAYLKGSIWYPAGGDVSPSAYPYVTLNLGDQPFTYTRPGYLPWAYVGETLPQKTHSIYLSKTYSRL